MDDLLVASKFLEIITRSRVTTFLSCSSDHSLYMYREGRRYGVYVFTTLYYFMSTISFLQFCFNNIVLTISFHTLREPFFLGTMCWSFQERYRNVSYFLNNNVIRNDYWLIQSHSENMLPKSNMSTCKPTTMPINTKGKLSVSIGPLFLDQTLSIVS